MLPERLYLSGFLCYRDGQEAKFTGRSLWMLAGANGSGKSTLFDAITFALYGWHRGGRQHADALIHRACDGLEVEFDFRLENELYQARRTLRRNGKGSWQIRHWREGAEGGTWQEVAQTNHRAGFDQWVREHVGLTYECFVASVMLRQGKADCLLEAAPRDRHHFLGEIVGLDHYKRLFERAKDRHADAKAQAENYSRRLRDVPEVTPAERHDAEEAARLAASDLAAAATNAAELSKLHVQAAAWQNLDARRKELSTKVELLDGLLARRAELETEKRQFEFLDHHLDRLETFVKQSRQHCDADRKLSELRPKHAKLSTEREQLARDSLAAAATLAEREQEAQRLGDYLQDMQREQADLAAAIPWLADAHRAQHLAEQSKRQAAEAAAGLDRLDQDRAALIEALPPVAHLEAAEDALQHCETALGQAKAQKHSADDSLTRFHEVSGHASCRYCGQSLPAEHVEAESARLHAERDAATRAFAQAQTDRETARLHREKLQKEHKCCEASLRKLDAQIQSERHRHESAQKNEQESAQRFVKALANLPETIRREVAPHGADLQSVSIDRDAWQEREAALAKCLNKVQGQAIAARKAIDESRREQQLREAQSKDLEQQWRLLEAESLKQQALLGQLQETLSTARESLPEPWRTWSEDEAAHQAPTLRHQWKKLRQDDVSGKFAQLQKHQTDWETTTHFLAEVERQIADILEPARCEAALIERQLQSAQDEQRQREQQSREAQETSARLQQSANERATLLKDHRQADRQRHLWSRLMDLLGRQGLQRDLVRQAERQIVDYAAAILDRLSCGSMQIELRCGSDDTEEQALDLLARTDSSPEPLDVHFLSGSQRFRIAVALALAIGQYAGRARPVRSVVIDEGFGCLDSDNRTIMASELRNLSTYLDRIILVSHQDEFITAFPDGYRCERMDGTTRLEEFHR